MDRRTRRMRAARFRARGTRLAAVLAVASAALAVLLTSTVGQAQESPKPEPEVDAVDMTPAPEPVTAGWEGQVGTDANLVAVQWAGDQAASYTFETRDGKGEWRQVAESSVFDNGPDEGTQDAVHGATPGSENVTEPVWVGRNVTGVRVRLDEGSAQDVTLHVVDSTRGEKPEGNLESTTTTTTPAPAAVPSEPQSDGGGGDGADTTTTSTAPALQGLGLEQGLAVAALASLVVAFVVRRRRVLAIIVVAVVALAACAPAKKGPPGSAATPGGLVSRSSWGGDLNWACPGGPEYAGQMATAIVHHTVNSNSYGPGDSVGMIRGIWAYHVQSLGYCDIAYNFIIDNYGTPFEGRMGGIDQPVIGAHSLNFNRGTTGIAMLGTFSWGTPSGGALNALENIIRWKFKVHGVDPFDDPAADIIGHRDVFATECPGSALYSYLPYTRHYVKAGW